MEVYSLGLPDYLISQPIAQSTCLSLTCSEKIIILMKKISFGFYRRKFDFSRGRRVVILVSDLPDAPHVPLKKNRHCFSLNFRFFGHYRLPEVIETPTKPQCQPLSMPSKKVWANILQRPDFIIEKKTRQSKINFI